MPTRPNSPAEAALGLASALFREIPESRLPPEISS